MTKVVNPRILSGGILPVYPTTNVSKSMNNLKKVENGFHPNKLPILVHNAELSTDSFKAKVMGTFYGQRMYDLVPSMSHLKRTYAQWSSWPETDQEKNFTIFTKGRPQPLSTQTSSDGALTINRPTVNIIGKPGAKTRVRSTKTRSASKTPQVPKGTGRGRGRPRSQRPNKTPRGRGQGGASKRATADLVGRGRTTKRSKVDLAAYFRESNAIKRNEMLNEQVGSDFSDSDLE